MGNTLVVLLFLVTITGCSPILVRSNIVFLSEKEVKTLRVNAVDCKEQLQSNTANCPPPAFARHNMDINFKYGRFCGANYPGLTHASGKDTCTLSETELLELARDYYRIRPIDDIDAACQNHDVCWLLNPNDKYQCNKNFKKTLDELRNKWERHAPQYTNTTQNRCASLAMDMSYASFLMENTSSNTTEEAGLLLGKVVTAPFDVAYGGLFFLENLFDSYPLTNEVCIVQKGRR